MRHLSFQIKKMRTVKWTKFKTDYYEVRWHLYFMVLQIEVRQVETDLRC